jgi:hypothetical protein
VRVSSGPTMGKSRQSLRARAEPPPVAQSGADSPQFRDPSLSMQLNEDTLSSTVTNRGVPLVAPHGRQARLIERMRSNPSGVRFADLEKLCRYYFGAPRRSSGSHSVFRTPWSGDPRVNIQNDHGAAKAYQVRQVLAAIDRYESERYKSEQREGGDAR